MISNHYNIKTVKSTLEQRNQLKLKKKEDEKLFYLEEIPNKDALLSSIHILYTHSLYLSILIEN